MDDGELQKVQSYLLDTQEILECRWIDAGVRERAILEGASNLIEEARCRLAEGYSPLPKKTRGKIAE